MERKQAYDWAQRNENRKTLLMSIKQPMTALQLSKRTGLKPNQCSIILGKLTLCGMVKCLNPNATRSRLYWLTPTGILCQKKLSKDKSLPEPTEKLLDIDWPLYGWLCYSHRAAIIKVLTEPMQPSTVKRRAKQQDSRIKMSANNVRDVIKLLLQKEIVKPLKLKKKAHLHYELTRTGQDLQKMLRRADCDL